jgi:hypothetical protein
MRLAGDDNVDQSDLRDHTSGCNRQPFQELDTFVFVPASTTITGRRMIGFPFPST